MVLGVNKKEEATLVPKYGEKKKMVLIYQWRGAGKEPSWRVGLVSGHEIPDL